MDKSTSGGVSFVGLLFIVFLVLKLTKVIAWSWWWVTAPLWIPVVLGIIMLAISVANVIRTVRKNRK